MANFKTRVLGILGQDNSDYLTDIADMPGIVNNSLWEMAKVLPTQYLLTESAALIDPENLAAGVDKKKLIKNKNLCGSSYYKCRRWNNCWSIYNKTL